MRCQRVSHEQDVCRDVQTPGVLGDLSKCESARLRDRADAQHSFASGHTTVSFAGMTFTALYMRAAFGVASGSHFNLQSK